MACPLRKVVIVDDHEIFRAAHPLGRPAADDLEVSR
jgi:hypothetical protein